MNNNNAGYRPKSSDRLHGNSLYIKQGTVYLCFTPDIQLQKCMRYLTRVSKILQVCYYIVGNIRLLPSS